MRNTVYNHQFAKVFVDRDHHALLGDRDAKNIFVARIRRPIACLRHVMTGLANHARRVARNTAIE